MKYLNYLVSIITCIPWLLAPEGPNLWVQGCTCVFFWFQYSILLCSFYLWILSICSLQKGLVYTFCSIEQGIISSACLLSTWLFQCESTGIFLEFVSLAEGLCIRFHTNHCIGDWCPDWCASGLKSVLIFGTQALSQFAVFTEWEWCNSAINSWWPWESRITGRFPIGEECHLASAVLCLYWKLVSQLKSENGQESGSLSNSVLPFSHNLVFSDILPVTKSFIGLAVGLGTLTMELCPLATTLSKDKGSYGYL